jgi:tetratricopeptide (TPR) repeat protein
LNDAAREATVLNNLGGLAEEQDDLERAIALLEEALALHRRLSSDHRVDRLALAHTLNNLAEVACKRRDYTGARPLLIESLMIRRSLSDRAGVANTLFLLGVTAQGRDEAARAACLFGAAEAARDALGIRLTPAYQRWRETHEAAAREALGAEAFARLFAQGHALDPEQAIEYALE